MNLTEVLIIGVIVLVVIMTFVEEPILSARYGKAFFGSVYKVGKGIVKIGMRIFDEFTVKAATINETIALTNHNIGNATEVEL